MSTSENSEATSKIRTFLLKAYFHFITTTYKHHQITYQKQAIIELDISNAVMVNNLLQNNLDKVVMEENENIVSTEEVQE